MNLNADGQPLNKSFNAARLNDRKIDELIGLCKGVLADGEVTQFEVEFLQQWLRNNQDISEHWPANVLYQRIEEMLADNVLDAEEQKELLQTLMDLTGEPTIHGSVNSMSTSLPLPPPRSCNRFRRTHLLSDRKVRNRHPQAVRITGPGKKWQPEKVAYEEY